MQYQVPQNIDNNKIFILNWSEIKGRLDPKMALYYRKVQNWSYPKVQLKNLLLSKPQYGAAEPGITRNDPKSPRYIRITDIDEYGQVSHDELGATANTIEDQYVLHENDLLIARSGATVGKAYIHKKCPYTCFFAGYLIRFVINPLKVLSDYVFAFTQTDTYKEWINATQRPSGQPNINSEEYQSLEIPLPPSDIQNEIVLIMQTAYSDKRKKELNALQQLESIDTYLLNELGIIIPPIRASLHDRIFIANYSKVSGSRFDPKFYSTSITQLKQSLFTSPFDKQTLKNFVKSSCSGEWGKEELEELDEDKYTKCLVIRATEFDNTYNLRLDNSRVKYRWIENSKLAKMNIQANDLLIEKSGGSEDQPVGRISILTDKILKENRIAYSNFIHKISVEGINPMYLYFYLKTMHNIKITDSMQSQTNGIRNLIMQEYFNQTIVVPSPQKQQEIVEHIIAIRKQAKALQEEGKNILEQAKREVERMIIAE